MFSFGSGVNKVQQLWVASYGGWDVGTGLMPVMDFAATFSMVLTPLGGQNVTLLTFGLVRDKGVMRDSNNLSGNLLVLVGVSPPVLL